MSNEAGVTVHGKDKYVVMPIEKYNYYRECDLEAATNEAKSGFEKGHCVIESVEKHIKRITNA